MIGPVSIGLTFAEPLIGIIMKGVDHWGKLKKAERDQLLRLRRELQSNLSALAFSRYDRPPALAIATPDFATLTGNLNAAAAFEALTANFSAKRPPKAAGKKQDLIRYTRYALFYTVKQIDSLKQLASFKAGQKLPVVHLKRRLDILTGHLEKLDKILAVVPVNLPPRKKAHA
jgi:hypothetical protein